MLLNNDIIYSYCSDIVSCNIGGIVKVSELINELILTVDKFGDKDIVLAVSGNEYSILAELGGICINGNSVQLHCIDIERE